MKSFELTTDEINEFSILPDRKFLDLHLMENDFRLDESIYSKIENLLFICQLERYRIFYAIGSLITFELSKQFMTNDDFLVVHNKNQIYQPGFINRLTLDKRGLTDKIVITDGQLINQVVELLQNSIPEPDELEELISASVNRAAKKRGAPKKKLNRFRKNLASHLITFLRLKEPDIFPSERQALKFIAELLELTGLQARSPSTEQSIDSLKKCLGK